jgi:hypothetical protein
MTMASKQDFTPEDWTKILESIMLTGIAVSAADPSGLWGTVKEAFASRSALAASKQNADSNELIKAALADFETKEGRSAVQDALREHIGNAQPFEIVQRSLDKLREVSAILDAKAPDDAAAFKTLLRDVSRKVAEASTEGGFLGLGGIRVSAAEKATLDEIADALSGTEGR